MSVVLMNTELTVNQPQLRVATSEALSPKVQTIVKGIGNATGNVDATLAVLNEQWTIMTMLACRTLSSSHSIIVRIRAFPYNTAYPGAPVYVKSCISQFHFCSECWLCEIIIMIIL